MFILYTDNDDLKNALSHHIDALNADIRYEFQDQYAPDSQPDTDQHHIILHNFTGKHTKTPQTHVFTTPFRLGAVLDCLQNLQTAHEAKLNFTVNGQQHTLDHGRLHQNQKLITTLTGTEQILLKTLITAAGTAINRDELLQTVWGYRPDLDTHTVETHIYRLRQKIESDPSQPQYIITTENGYILPQDPKSAA